MNRRDFLRTTSVGIGMSALFPSWAWSAKRKKPNFVLIMVDDMGYSDPGCFGGEVQTPNIDRLAKGGMRFTQFYNCAKCSPTRATLLTGQYDQAVGTQDMKYGVTFGELPETTAHYPRLRSILRSGGRVL